MKFKFVSHSGDGMGVALRLIEEGNEVTMWIEDHDATDVGDGLVPKVGLIFDLLEDATPGEDVFVFDSSGQGIRADYLRSKGFDVIGGSLLADRLEHDRNFGLKAMTDSGILVPESATFKDFDKAIEFVKKNKDKRFVYKPEKLLGELSMSHVAKDAEDLAEYLSNTKDEVKLEDPEFVLQEFLEGAALSSEAWFDGTSFLPLFNHTLERKELMNDNIGPSGGCTGNVVWACGDCPICRAGIVKMEAFLRKEHYVGMLDLNCIVTEEGEAYGLEWTPRFGYDGTPTLLYGLLDGEIGQLLSDVAKFQYNAKSPELRPGAFAGAVRITVPPWPTEKHHAQGGVPILGLEEKDFRSTYLYNVKLDREKEDQLVTSGAWGIICLFITHGATLGRAFANPYELAKKIKLTDKQYRTDLIHQFKEDLAKLGDSIAKGEGNGIYQRVG